MSAFVMAPLLGRIEDGPGGCWLWTGAKRNGYGVVRHRGRMANVHRVVYEACVGPIPEGHVVDHLCRVRACCRPDHLEAVTQRTNIMRGEGVAANQAQRTACPAGHPYDEANTYRLPSRPNARYCRACQRERRRDRRARA